MQKALIEFRVLLKYQLKKYEYHKCRVQILSFFATPKQDLYFFFFYR